MSLPDGAVIEVIEYTDHPEQGHILPNEIRINGKSVLAPADDPVIVHEISTTPNDLVKVTLTVYAKRITFASEQKPSP